MLAECCLLKNKACGVGEQGKYVRTEDRISLEDKKCAMNGGLDEVLYVDQRLLWQPEGQATAGWDMEVDEYTEKEKLQVR